MDYADFKTGLTALAPQSKFLQFIADRVRQNDYRGYHLSQHNRFSFDEAEAILTEFQSFAKGKKIKIRTRDLSKEPNDMPGTEVYSDFCASLTSKYGKYTQDTVRKNIFVDFARMGLIKRYNTKGFLITGTRGRCVYVELADRGKILASKSKTKKEKYIAFTKGLDSLLQGMPLTLFDLMSETNFKITRKEYTYFASFLNHKIYTAAVPAGKTVTKQDVIDYINEYRSMSGLHSQIDNIVKEYCNPFNFPADKPEKRDYDNWLNETEQVFTLLSQTVYFDHMEKYHTLKLRVDKKMNIDNVDRIKRSSQEKENYFSEHRITKPNGTTLHHIVPLSEWKDLNDFKLLDDWRNMICIEQDAHNDVHAQASTPINLSFSGDKKNLILSSGCTLTFANNETVYYSERKITDMENYNKNILETLEL
ncbi:MAG: hypothetical protein K2J54_05780 [Clostridia bacterium]|nr:hypothetical protein [Clostridia bacterium]